jgi:hypothetical protein
MKKMNYLVLALLMLGLTISCTNQSSPGKAAKRYMEYAAKGDFEKFVDGFYFGEEVSKEEIKEGKAMMVSLVGEKVKPAFDKKGGLKSVEVVSETLSDDGKSAEAVLKLTYGNGETDEDTIDMILVDGKWLMEQ